MQTFDFYTDDTRKAIKYEKNSKYYDNAKCEGDPIYVVDSTYTLAYISEWNSMLCYSPEHKTRAPTTAPSLPTCLF